MVDPREYRDQSVVPCDACMGGGAVGLACTLLYHEESGEAVKAKEECIIEVQSSGYCLDIVLISYSMLTSYFSCYLWWP